MIRKILRVKTTGSKRGGDLAPAIELPRGLNMTVLEYDESEGWCVIEVWGSDHPVLSVEERATPEKIRSVVNQAIEVLPFHPLSPRLLGQVYGEVGEYKVDRETKHARREMDGKVFTFLRVERRGFPREDEIVIFDEG